VKQLIDKACIKWSSLLLMVVATAFLLYFGYIELKFSKMQKQLDANSLCCEECLIYN